jgi:hypothetical protein
MLDRVTTTVTGKASNLKDQVVVALNDGRSAAREREAQLRAERDEARTITPTPSSPSSPLDAVD